MGLSMGLSDGRGYLMSGYILFYHRIFPHEPAPDKTLSLFEWEMSYLKKHYQVLSLDELLDYIQGRLVLERPAAAITFDDGWFDNFVYAYPVLEKYGLKATIFVSTGKIRSENSVRPTLKECWKGSWLGAMSSWSQGCKARLPWRRGRGTARLDGRAALDNLQKPKGVEESFLESLSGNLQEFLTWEELRVMQKSGIFSVQSHGVEHKSIFSGEDINGFIKGDPGWKIRSAAKDMRIGVPLYPMRSSLGARAYYPDPLLNNHMASYYSAYKGIEEKGIAEKCSKSEEDLMREVERFKSSNPQDPGKWETDADMRKRILGELTESRDKITSEIGVAPVHFCWPWGQYTDLGVNLARDAGYNACYTTKAGSVSTMIDRYRMPRVSTTGGKVTFVKRGLIYTNPKISKAYLFFTKRR
jgi:peptidoglycan/xylan/chitin deacetylase (PgdA/CDA1 family)